MSGRQGINIDKGSAFSVLNSKEPIAGAPRITIVFMQRQTVACQIHESAIAGLSHVMHHANRACADPDKKSAAPSPLLFFTLLPRVDRQPTPRKSHTRFLRAESASGAFR